MQFVFIKSCGEQHIALEGEAFAHICQVRRAKIGTLINARNLDNDTLYTYCIESITRKNATLTLQSCQILPKIPAHFSHIIWAITSPQVVYKTLPYLNELALGKLSLFYAKFSQGNVRIEMERVKRILIESCEQCGRSSLCEVEILKDLDSVLSRYPQASVLDFGGKMLESSAQTREMLRDGIIIGCEGGFSDDEREIFKAQKRNIYGLKNELILRSQSAAITMLAKGL